MKVPINRLEGPEGRKWALTYLRQELAQICDARVCLGGKLTNFSGWMPGVVKEGVYTIAVRRPLYVSEIFGGAAKAIANDLDRPGGLFEFVPIHRGRVFQALGFCTWYFAGPERSGFRGGKRGGGEREPSPKDVLEIGLVACCIELILRGLNKMVGEKS